MSKEMIERVARAICRRHWPNEDKWEIYTYAAEAAIETLKISESITVIGTLRTALLRISTLNADNPVYEAKLIAAEALKQVTKE